VPRFIDIHHDMQGIDQKQLEEAHRMDLEHEAREGVHFLHAWADPNGTVFCLSEAPDKEAVLRVHEEAGHATNEIYEVSFEVE
jgi:hypothetical protein